MTEATPNAEAFAAEADVMPVVVDNPSSAIPANTSLNSKFYTEEDLAKVRSQEKEKLYPQIDKLKEEVDSLRREREEEAARRAADESAKAQAEAAKLKEKEEIGRAHV